MSGTVLGLLLLAACGAGAESTYLDSFVPSSTAPEAFDGEGDADGSRQVSLLSIDSVTHHGRPGVVATYESSASSSFRSFWASAQLLLVWNVLTGLSLTSVLKVLCVTSTMLVQVSPFPQVRRWEKRGDTGAADPAPYVSIAFGGWQWCFYGAFAWMVTGRQGFLVLVQSNTLGALLGAYYIFAFFRRCRSEEARTALFRYLGFAASIAVFELSAMTVMQPKRALFLVGLISAFCSFMNALSVLVTVPTVLREKDSRSIPGPIVAASCLTSFFWAMCGIMLTDRLITVPSCVGMLANTICLSLKFIYPSTEDCEPPSKQGDFGSEDPVLALKQDDDCSKEEPCEQNGAAEAQTLRAKLRERMERRWRSALKPTERTPLLSTSKPQETCKQEAAPSPEEADTGGTC